MKSDHEREMNAARAKFEAEHQRAVRAAVVPVPLLLLLFLLLFLLL